MRLLFIGDVVGRSGREALERHLPDLKETLCPDLVVVNGENAAGGLGITSKICKSFFTGGVDCITSGNHIWKQKEIIGYIDGEKRLLRPANFVQTAPGRGIWTHQLVDGRKAAVINLMGRIFMDPVDDPFAAVDRLLEGTRLGEGHYQLIFVDMHAEATSEKMTMAHYLDGRVSAVIGSHTHIPTADNQILSGGTAYQSDAGMAGDYDSVIGVKKDVPLGMFVRQLPGERMSPAEGEATLCGSFVVTDDRTGLARSIAPVRLGGRLAQAQP